MQFWHLTISSLAIAMIAVIVALYYNIQAGKHLKRSREYSRIAQREMEKWVVEMVERDIGVKRD